MATRNGLLGDIVLASGGVITDKDNRNKLLGDWLTAVAGEERYFRRNSGGIDYATIPAVTLTVDYSITFDMLIGASADGMAFGDSVGSTFLLVFADGSVRLRNSSAIDVNAPAGSFIFGQLNTISLVRAGLTLTIFVNGSSVASGASAESLVFNQLYASSAGFPLQGIIANLTIADAGTPIRSYAIDDNDNVTDKIIDSVSGQDGTVINGDPDDWGLFTRKGEGLSWFGIGLAVPPWDSVNQELPVA